MDSETVPAQQRAQQRRGLHLPASKRANLRWVPAPIVRMGLGRLTLEVPTSGTWKEERRYFESSGEGAIHHGLWRGSIHRVRRVQCGKVRKASRRQCPFLLRNKEMVLAQWRALC